MEKAQGPVGYPGDEAIKKAFGAAVRALRLERGLSSQELSARIRAKRVDRHEFLPQAMALTVRRIRKLRKMTCKELSDASGLPLRFILSIEHAKTSNLVLTDIFRLSMAMKYPTPEFAQEIADLEQTLERRANGKGKRSQ
jgi:hypothetical protein